MSTDERVAEQLMDVRQDILAHQDGYAPTVDRELVTAIDNWLKHYRKVAEIHEMH